MRSLPTSVLSFALVASLAFVLAACSSDEEGGGGDCRPGESLVNGVCVPIGPGSGVNPGTTPTQTGAGPGSTVGPGPTFVPPEIQCTPGEPACADPATLGICNDAGDGVTGGEECSSSQRCLDGSDGSPAQCVLGTVIRCEPGEFLNCAGRSEEELCSPRGFAENVFRPCPSGTQCFSSLGCTDAVCEPGVLSCDGNAVVECNAAGTEQTQVRTCPTGCAQGQCIDPCVDPSKGGFVGCDFLGVYLDQYRVRCGSGSCPVGTACGGGDEFCGPTANQTDLYAITVSNTNPSPVNITITFTETDTVVGEGAVDPNGLRVFNIAPPAGAVAGTRIDSRSYRVEADGAVTVHQFNPASNVGAFSNDASLLLPSNAVGQEYLVLGWPPTPNQSTYVTIVGTEDDTQVTVTPSISIPAGGGLPAMPANQPTTFDISAGQVATLVSNRDAQGGDAADVTGTFISATAPVTAFYGAECVNVPAGTGFCDHIEQKLYPIETWGHEFVLSKFAPRGNERDYYRVMALEDGTRLETFPFVNNVTDTVLNRGEFVQFASREDILIRAVDIAGQPKPISVAQYMVGSGYLCSNPSFGREGCAIPGDSRCTGNSGIGDPSMLLMVPNQQFLNNYTFLVPGQYEENHITIIKRINSEVRIDGSPVTETGTPVRNTPFEVVRRAVQVPAGSDGLVLNASGDQPFGLYVYGYDCDVSYAYPGGLNLETIRPPGSQF